LTALPDGNVLMTGFRGLVVADTDAPSVLGSKLSISGLASMSSDGRRVALVDARTVRVLDSETLDTIKVLNPTIAPVIPPSLSADGSLVAVTDRANTEVIDVASGRIVVAAHPSFTIITTASFSPDGRYVAIPLIAGVDVVEISTGRTTTFRTGGQITSSMSWNPAGDRLAVSDLQVPAVVIDPSNALNVGPSLPNGPVAWHPSGNSLVVFSPTQDVTLVELSTGTRHTLSGYTGYAEGDFTSDGNTIVRVRTGPDNSLLLDLFDVPTATRIGPPLTLFRHETGSFAAPYSRACRCVIVSSTSGPVIRYNLDESTWPHVACAMAGRNLTNAEWSQYFAKFGERRPTCP
jgi:WD40 repeat protein